MHHKIVKGIARFLVAWTINHESASFPDSKANKQTNKQTSSVAFDLLKHKWGLGVGFKACQSPVPSPASP